MPNCTACARPLGPRNRTGLCRSCVARRNNADPVITARRIAATKVAFVDPVRRARHVRTAMRNLAIGHEKMLAHVHPAYRDEYRRIQRSKTIPAADAARIVNEMARRDRAAEVEARRQRMMRGGRVLGGAL